MKIVFVQPKIFHTWEALNIGYLSSYLRMNGHKDLHFFSGFFETDEQIIQGCQDADIIGFSCTSPQMKHALLLAKAIKNSKNHIVFGGVHPSALPEDTIESEYVDAVVLGEGENAFLDIVQSNRERMVKNSYLKKLVKV